MIDKYGRSGEPTLIIVSIMLTEPKTAFAGVMLETSFARFKVSMATFSEESTLSRRFGCGALRSMDSKSIPWHEKTLWPAGICARVPVLKEVLPAAR